MEQITISATETVVVDTDTAVTVVTGILGPPGPQGAQGPQGPEGPATNITTLDLDAGYF